MGFFDPDYANLSNLAFIEGLYHQYLQDPESVDLSFRRFFEGMEFSKILNKIQPQKEEKLAYLPQDECYGKDFRAFLLIEAYRRFGHLVAKCNPLKNSNDLDIRELDIQACGFLPRDLDKQVDTFGFFSEEKVSLKNLVERLKTIYTSSLGVEAYHVRFEVQDYIYAKWESFFQTPFSSEEKISILKLLNKSEIFESFLHIRYPGQKRFSIEGGESLIPLLVNLYKTAAKMGCLESVLGMAHRGRLNVLSNILSKSYDDIFHEFDPHYKPQSVEGSGDVKYHKGLMSEVVLEGNLPFKISLADNPSHLESVNTVVMGMTKAKQLDKDLSSVLPVLIHGDASVAGQGVVYEGMQLMNLEGYGVGGAIHIVVNNQVGFTATAKESRSTLYPTDIAKAFGCPIFHVNGDDPQSCVLAAQMAAEIRQKFALDVFIEILCYRKYGHNEGDEPFFTQPKLYEKIKKKKNVRNLYRDRLIEEGLLSEDKAQDLEKEFREELEKALHKTQEKVEKSKQTRLEEKADSDIRLTDVFFDKETLVDKETLKKLAEKFCALPEDLNVHPKIQKLFQNRLEAVLKEKEIEWGLSEYLAYASLLTKGYPVRISGQDSQRGTFSHRHALIVDQATEKKYFPLAHLDPKQASFTIYNSCLSEYGVLGFEFGYSTVMRQGLTIWEAQFGDFANGAQIIIDQYLSSSEQKWGLKSPLVLFLPHGYEGMGPEHSSARMERYLQLCAQYNLEVVIPSTSAQMFHLLRKHVLAQVEKPLVVFTPKELLRYPPSSSLLKDFTEGSFQEIIDDDPSYRKATRLLICCGKIYYELIEERKKREASHIAIIRIEKIYPFHQEKFLQILSHYPDLKECFFVQEEHSNMGAYQYLSGYLREKLPDNLKLCYVGRSRSASTAAGSSALHKHEKTIIVEHAFGKVKSS